MASDGSLLPLTAFIFGQHYAAFGKVDRLQLEQDRPGAVVVRIVPAAGWTLEDEERLRRDMRAAIGEEWHVDIERVDSIPLTDRGKHRFVIQHLPLTGVWDGDQSTRRSMPSTLQQSCREPGE